MQLTLAGFIGLAGIVGSVHLLPLLSEWRVVASRPERFCLHGLAGNLFLGSQICWYCRPFILGSGEAVVLLVFSFFLIHRPRYFHGSFFWNGF